MRGLKSPHFFMEEGIMKQATIILKDEVNCRIEGLSLSDRQRLSKKFALMVPYAYHMPSYKLGRWDGKIHFFSQAGVTYNNILDDIVPILIDCGYELDIDDRRKNYDFSNFEPINENSFEHIKWPKGHPHEGKSVMLRDYQVDAVNKFLENPQCIQELSTSSGKTIITASLSKLVEPYGRTIVIVPNKSLVVQTYQDYENIGLDVGMYYGGQKDTDKTHTICTWQSLEAMDKQHRAGKRDTGLTEFAEGVVAVIVDEAHKSDAAVLKKILSGPFANIPIRWGLTGTIPKDEVSQMSLKVNLGEVVNQVKASDLQKKGILSSCNINILQTIDNVFYNNYQSELSYLVTDNDRLEWMADLIEDIRKSGNTLVLVDRKKTGYELTGMLENSVFVYGETKQEERKKQYDSINDSNNKVLISTFAVSSTGISITKLNNIVLIEPGKSFVRVIQSIGRGLRKGFDKDHVDIWDITSTAKFSKRHLTERKKFYKEAEYPFTLKKINYREK